MEIASLVFVTSPIIYAGTGRRVKIARLSPSPKVSIAVQPPQIPLHVQRLRPYVPGKPIEEIVADVQTR